MQISYLLDFLLHSAGHEGHEDRRREGQDQRGEAARGGARQLQGEQGHHHGGARRRARLPRQAQAAVRDEGTENI